MGYDLHIFRGDDWSDPERPQISMEEWRALIAADPSLDRVDEATATAPEGETISYRSDGLATWGGHPDRSTVWLDFSEGSIVVKNPDEPTIAKLVDLAEALAARVQGDDGEFYGPEKLHPAPKAKRRWPFRR